MDFGRDQQLRDFDGPEFLHEAAVQSTGQVTRTERLVLLERSAATAITIEQVVTDFIQERLVLAFDDQSTVLLIIHRFDPNQGGGAVLAKAVNGPGGTGQPVFFDYQVSFPCMVLRAPRVRKTCSGSWV